MREMMLNVRMTEFTKLIIQIWQIYSGNIEVCTNSTQVPKNFCVMKANAIVIGQSQELIGTYRLCWCRNAATGCAIIYEYDDRLLSFIF